MHSKIEISVGDIVQLIIKSGLDKKYFGKGDDNVTLLNRFTLRSRTSVYKSNEMYRMFYTNWGKNHDTPIMCTLPKERLLRLMIDLKNYMIGEKYMRQTFIYYKKFADGRPIDEDSASEVTAENTKYQAQKLYLYDANRINLYENTNLFYESNSFNGTRLLSASLTDRILGFSRNDDNIYWVQDAIHQAGKYAYDINHDRHFTITADGTMTYTPKHKRTVMNNNQKWIKDARQNIKYGKGIRKMLQQANIYCPDSAIEKMSNTIKSLYVFDFKLEVVEGMDIASTYSYKNHSESVNIGSLSNSCMKHTECQDYFEIYTENPDKVKMVRALDNDNKTVARAILWYTDGGDIFMDRIYGSDIAIAKFQSYAKENGWLHKNKQNYHDYRMVNSIGAIVDKELTVTLQNSENRKYPYMDTMKYTDDLNGDEIQLCNSSGDITLESTEGGPHDENMVTLHDGNRVHQEDAVWVESEGDYYHNDDTVYSELQDQDILYETAIELQGDGYVTEDFDDMAMDEDSGDYYHTDELYYSEYDGCWYHNAFECPIKGFISESNTQTFEIEYEDDSTECYDMHEDCTQEEIQEYVQSQTNLEVRYIN